MGLFVNKLSRGLADLRWVRNYPEGAVARAAESVLVT